MQIFDFALRKVDVLLQFSGVAVVLISQLRFWYKARKNLGDLIKTFLDLTTPRSDSTKKSLRQLLNLNSRNSHSLTYCLPTSSIASMALS
jgi:hypothetical protein